MYGFGDSSFNDDREEGQSSCGYSVQLGGRLISWKATLPAIKSLSTMEAETVISSIAAREMVWIRHLLDSIWGKENVVQSVLHTDNVPTEFNANNLQVTDKSKHIRPKYFYVRDLVESRLLSISKVPTSLQVADIFTKPLTRISFERHRNALGVAKTRGS